jgi:hypothetical protein
VEILRTNKPKFENPTAENPSFPCGHIYIK